jgi:predicted O-linked N-acetylglucosamine transferase (SPINDLY family)
MVDTPHWSGGNTAIDALLCDVPIVTCPGPYMRGRQSLAMLTRLGLDQALSCTGTAQLAARAVAIASDREQRANIAHRIAEGRQSLFDGAAALRALHDAAAELIEKS